MDDISLIVAIVALSLCVVVTVAFGVLAGFLCCALHILRAEVALLSKSLWFWVHFALRKVCPTAHPC